MEQEMRIGEDVKNKNLGGDIKDENKKQNDSDGGNSNCAVLAVLSGYACDCC
jgi:hypothetical protein